MWKPVEAATLGFLLLAVSTFAASAQKSPRDLQRDIFQNYNPKVIPVKRAGGTVTANISLVPIAIRELDEYHETLLLDSWLVMTWHDQYLTWDTQAYDGIDSLRIPLEEIWTPDIAIFTASPVTKILPEPIAGVVITNTGLVTGVLPVTFSNRCPLDLSDYPHDTQTCSLKFGSWTHSEKSGIILQLKEDVVDLSDYTDNNQEWSMVTATARKKDNYYRCCHGENYPFIFYNITIKRRISPEVRVSDVVSVFAVFISLLMFWFPPNTTLKVLTGILAELLLSFDALYLGHTFASPAILEKATERVYPFMCLVAAALILEILISFLERAVCPFKPPAILLSLANDFCPIFCVSASRSSGEGGDMLPEVSLTDKEKTPVGSLQEDWSLVAMALDRTLFVLYLIVSVFFCYFSLN